MNYIHFCLAIKTFCQKFLRRENSQGFTGAVNSGEFKKKKKKKSNALNF